MERPWQSPVPPLLSSVCEVVAFPSDDEKDGMAVMAWRGPKAGDRYFYSAIVALVEYLHSTSVAPLQIGLVHVDEPYCSEVGVAKSPPCTHHCVKVLCRWNCYCKRMQRCV